MGNAVMTISGFLLFAIFLLSFACCIAISRRQIKESIPEMALTMGITAIVFFVVTKGWQWDFLTTPVQLEGRDDAV